MSLLPEKTSTVLKTLNGTVKEFLSASQLDGFEKAWIIAEAAGQLKLALTDEYMKPIMDLQNNRLGFRTDRPTGYDQPTVKNCLIEAVLTGVQPFGNQFNIIAGSCYITKEGFKYLLDNFPGLDYETIPDLPRINQDKSGAAVKMKVVWTLKGNLQQAREMDLAIRMNNGMGVDAVIGKATRKARKWLYEKLTGMEIGDGDVTDIDSSVVSSKVNIPTHSELTKLLEEREPLLTKSEFDSAKRILDNKEENSYRKLLNLLESKSAQQNEQPAA